MKDNSTEIVLDCKKTTDSAMSKKDEVWLELHACQNSNDAERHVVIMGKCQNIAEK